MPDDQEQLDEKALDEEHTQIIRAEDPNAPDNISLYNFSETAFKVQPTGGATHMGVHIDKSYAFIMHRESEDAKAQLAMEAQIIEKEKDVLKQLRTDTTTVEGVGALARDGRLPEHVKKLIEGYDLRVYWFEVRRESLERTACRVTAQTRR